MTTSIKPLFEVETTEAIISQKMHHSPQEFNGLGFEATKTFPVFAFAKKGTAMRAAMLFNKHHHFCQVNYVEAHKQLATLRHDRLKAVVERINQQGVQGKGFQEYVFLTSEWTLRSIGTDRKAILRVALQLKREGKQIVTSNQMVMHLLRSYDISCAFYKDKFYVLNKGAEHVFVGTKAGTILSTRIIQSLYMGHKIRIALV